MQFPKTPKEWEQFDDLEAAYQLYKQCEKNLEPFQNKLKELEEKRREWIKQHEQEVREAEALMQPIWDEYLEAKGNFHNARAMSIDWMDRTK
jgi:exonuclease VII small subunit